MKKFAAVTIAALSIFSTNSWADSAFLYCGMDVFQSNAQFNYDYPGGSDYIRYKSTGYKLQFGMSADTLRFQLYWQSQKFNDNSLYYTNQRLTEMGFDLIKTFRVSRVFHPFIQAGLGVGSMALDTNHYAESFIGEKDLKLGTGVIFRVAPSVELLGGVDLAWRNWNSVDYFTGTRYQTLNTNDTSERFYFGVNFLFN